MIVDNGALARICVDHELLNENPLYPFSCQKSLFFFPMREDSALLYGASLVNCDTTGARVGFFFEKENKKCNTSRLHCIARKTI